MRWLEGGNDRRPASRVAERERGFDAYVRTNRGEGAGRGAANAAG